MNKNLLFFLTLALFFSCSHKKQIVYLNDIDRGSVKKLDLYTKDNIKIGDVLKIDISSVISEASDPFNSSSSVKQLNSLDLLIIDGYLVNNDSTINFPILDEIKVVGYTENELSLKLKKVLIDLGHLINPYVKVKKINSKFTILGDVRNPGTYSNFDKQLNIFQAIGYAGDLLITAKRNEVTLLREENGLRKTYKFSLNSKEILDKSFYYVKSNDVIIIEPNFSKIKSAGFIGSPASIASLSSLILSITLLLINK